MSIERTAYPRFRRIISTAELRNHFTVQPDEAAWAAERTDSAAYRLALVLVLKCFARMSHFSRVGEIPRRWSTSCVGAWSCP